MKTLIKSVNGKVSVTEGQVKPKRLPKKEFIRRQQASKLASRMVSSVNHAIRHNHKDNGSNGIVAVRNTRKYLVNKYYDKTRGKLVKQFAEKEIITHYV